MHINKIDVLKQKGIFCDFVSVMILKETLTGKHDAQFISINNANFDIRTFLSFVD